MKIKGFDQSTAWIAAVLAAAIVGGIVNWLSKRSYNAEIAEEQALVAKLRGERGDDEAEDHTEPNHAPHQSEHGQTKSDLAFGAPGVVWSIKGEWGYSGSIGPNFWAQLDPSFAMCGKGKRQSPVDIVAAAVDHKIKPVKFFYRHGLVTLMERFQTVVGQVESGSYLERFGDRFDLEMFMVRTPSEHRVTGLPFEAELQLLHRSIDGKILIVSVLVENGRGQPEIARLFAELPGAQRDAVPVERVQPEEMLPRNRRYVTYDGSLSMPPCTEGVEWIVMADPVVWPTAIIDRLAQLQKHNARPVQPLQGRVLRRLIR